MSLQTNLSGRLRNTSLPKSHALMPIFEAVVNSIHSIEEVTDNIRDGRITLTIVRNRQLSTGLDNAGLPEITGFKITDNGAGFNEINYKSFQTLDSEHKISKGCRGIGRLLWLKVFSRAHISSTYEEDGCKKFREFQFSRESGAEDKEATKVDDDNSISTSVLLQDINDDYVKAIPAKAETIAMRLLEHCVWHFVRDQGCPEIIVEDEFDSINLTSLYDEHITTIADYDSFTINNYVFELTHIKFRASHEKKHQLSYCAAGRLVKEENLENQVSGLYGVLTDDKGEFFYNCYITSTYLDEKVRAERTSFDIAEKPYELLKNAEVSFQQIRSQSVEKSKAYLSEFLEMKKKEAIEHTTKYIQQKAPRYKMLSKYFDEDALIIDPNVSDKDLEKKLHAMWYQVEQDILDESYTYLQNDEITLDNYEEKLSAYIDKVSDLKASDLANYVVHRKVVLDILDKAIGFRDGKNYYNENILHELIYPMGKTSEEVPFDKQNLWLIDDRLAFHNYLASDKTIKSMPITDSGSTTEPDIVCYKEDWDNPFLVNDQANPPFSSITIIELKKPMRNDMKEGTDKDPIEQCLNYLEKIRDGNEATQKGLLIPKADNVPAYCYVIADMTPKMIQRSKLKGLKVTSDGMGYFGYNENYKAYIEVISYNKLLQSAKERNKAFFDKLGLAST